MRKNLPQDKHLSETMIYKVSNKHQFYGFFLTRKWVIGKLQPLLSRFAYYERYESIYIFFVNCFSFHLNSTKFTIITIVIIIIIIIIMMMIIIIITIIIVVITIIIIIIIVVSIIIITIFIIYRRIPLQLKNLMQYLNSSINP